jgi:hypothetical protein
MTTPVVGVIELPPPRDRAEFQQRIREERIERRRQTTDRQLATWGRRVGDIGGFVYVGAVRVVQFPFVAVDLLDAKGKPDHTKILPFLVCQELIGLQAFDVVYNHHAPSVAVSMLVASLAFGFAGFKLLLKSKTLTVASTETHATSTSLERKEVDVKIQQKIEETKRLITETRDTDTGEPLPDAPGQEVSK